MSKRAPSGAAGTPGVCRCCLAVGRFRQLGRTYNWLGSTEHYATMLRTCFNIAIPHYDGVDGTGKALICAVCVTQLRDAYNFKRQVELSQRRFSDVLQACDDRININRMLAEQKGGLVKQESAERSGTESGYLFLSEGEDQAADEPDNAEFHCVEDQEPISEVRPEGAAPEETGVHPTSDEYVIAIEVEEDCKTEQAAHFEIDVESDGEPADVKPPAAETRAGGPAPSRAPARRKRSEDADYSPNKRRVPRKTAKVKTKESGSRALLRNPPGSTSAPQRQPVAPAHRMTVINAAQLIEHSQAVPFKCRQSTYLCFYCAQEFTDAELLKAHTRTHRVTSNDIVYSIKTKNDLVKVDITSLDCKLCEKTITDIATLKQHLIEAHDKRFADDVADGLLPFRLTESLSCVVCAKRFPYFHVLNKHMNVHFNLFICEVCGGGFATRARMASHAEVHATIDEPCPVCGKVFKLRHRLRLHVQLIHERRGNQTCNYCPARFLDYHQKLKHQLSVHGEAPRQFPCDACGRVLASRRNLTRHVKRDHLRERNFGCPFCEKRFYDGSTLKNHLAVHSKERNFKCAHCGHCYSTKKVLNDHIKRLHQPRKEAVKN